MRRGRSSRHEDGTSMRNTTQHGLPPAQGLYRPEFEHDSCGVGFVAHIKGKRSHQIIADADHLLCRMDHRGARGAEPNTGDGAGMRHGAAARVPGAESRRKRSASTCRRRASSPRASCSCRTDAAERERCKAVVAAICAEEGQRLVGWRRRPDATPTPPISGTARARGAAHRAAVRRSRRRLRGRRVRAQALPDPQAREPPAARRHDR